MTPATSWTEFGLRQVPPMSSRTRVAQPSGLVASMIEAVHDDWTRPPTGITVPPTRLITPLESRIANTGPLVDAACAFLDTLDATQRERVSFPLDAAQWRQWFNIHPNVLRHGLMLEELSVDQRQAALKVMTASLSARGFAQARDIMRINGLLVAITGRADDFGEWPYFISLFGRPSDDEPWGWQLDGHHLALNVVVCDGRRSMTPCFMGSEPCSVESGPLAGTEVFGLETEVGLDLFRSLDAAQADIARVYTSIMRADLPAEFNHNIDGRMVGGAFRDNAVIEHAGLRGDALTDAQRRLLLRLVGAYVGWGSDDHATVRMDEVAAHLDDTSFLWMGAFDDVGPFYYRVLSPVVLIEFDHHHGIVFDNVEPTRHHIHTVLRTPNKGDYGLDLLAEHYERFSHT
jgi:hypothetical protein